MKSKIINKFNKKRIKGGNGDEYYDIDPETGKGIIPEPGDDDFYDPDGEIATAEVINSTVSENAAEEPAIASEEPAIASEEPAIASEEHVTIEEQDCEQTNVPIIRQILHTKPNKLTPSGIFKYQNNFDKYFGENITDNDMYILNELQKPPNVRDKINLKDIKILSNKINNITQKLYFFVLQKQILHFLLNITEIGLKQEKKFLTVCSGSFFVRLQTEFSLNTSDYDIKLFNINGDAMYDYENLMNIIRPAYLKLTNYLNKKITLNINGNLINTTYIAKLTYDTMNKNIFKILNKKQSNGNLIQTLFFILFNKIINGAPTIEINKKPDDERLLKIIVKEYLDVQQSQLDKIYALSDLSLDTNEQNLVVSTTNNLIKNHPDRDFYASIVNGYTQTNADGSDTDYNLLTNYSSVSETLPINPANNNCNYFYIDGIKILNTKKNIPEIVSYLLYGKPIYVPSPKYSYYEKKLLYCDIAEDENEPLCRNFDEWGFEKVGEKRINNVDERTLKFFRKKFSKSLNSITNKLEPLYQGGKKRNKTIKTKHKNKKRIKTIKPIHKNKKYNRKTKHKNNK